MTNEVDTTTTQICDPARIAEPVEVMLALLRALRIRRRPLDVPRPYERKLPNGCAFAVRYSSR